MINSAYPGGPAQGSGGYPGDITKSQGISAMQGSRYPGGSQRNGNANGVTSPDDVRLGGIGGDDLDNLPEINFNSEGAQAIQFVRYNRANGKFELMQDAVDLLCQYDGKIGFVCLAGNYRTGKSFLLNRILNAPSGQGFKVDPRVNACTEGIWIWSKPVFNEKDDSLIFFLDTEGTASVERDANHDAKILSLALLMCTYFIYNSVGCIDESSINNLNLMTQISQRIAVRAGIPADEYSLSAYAPKFLWLLRDFVLEIQDSRGRPITSAQYLENSLVDPQIIAKSSENSRKIRMALLSFFKDRDCVTIVRPVDDEAQLKNLNNIPVEQIRPDFLRTLNLVRDKILNKCSPKQLNGTNLTPRSYLAMIESFIEAVNTGSVPTISTAWDYILHSESVAAFKSAKEFYQTGLRKKFEENTKAKPMKELYASLMEIRDSAMDLFYQMVTNRDITNTYFTEMNDKLKEYIADKEAKAFDINNKINNTNCEDQIQGCFTELERGISQNRYNEATMNLFAADFVDAIRRYDEVTAGETKCETLTKFLQVHYQRMLDKIMEDLRRALRNQSNLKEREVAINQRKEEDYAAKIKSLEDYKRTTEEQIKKLKEERAKAEDAAKKAGVDLQRAQQQQQELTTKMNAIPRVSDNEVSAQRVKINELKKTNDELRRNIETLTRKIASKKGCCGP